MSVFWINTAIVGRDGQRRWGFAVDVKAFNTVDELADALQQGAVLKGDWLHLVDDGKGRKLVTQRTRVAIGLAGFATAQIYEHEVWEPED